MGNPQAYFLNPFEIFLKKTGHGRVSTTERVLVHNDGLVNLSGLKVQSIPMRKYDTG